MICDVPGGLLVSASPAEDEVVQAGDPEHGVVDAVALQPAVAEDLPALHPGEDVLDAGTDLAVEALCSSFQSGSSLWPFSRRCGMTRPVPR